MAKGPEIFIGKEKLMSEVVSEKKDFHNSGLHHLKIDNGIFIDGERLKGVLEYGVCQQEGNDYATLTLKMDVTILNYGRTPKNDKGANFCGDDARNEITV